MTPRQPANEKTLQKALDSKNKQITIHQNQAPVKKKNTKTLAKPNKEKLTPAIDTDIENSGDRPIPWWIFPHEKERIMGSLGAQNSLLSPFPTYPIPIAPNSNLQNADKQLSHAMQDQAESPSFYAKPMQQFSDLPIRPQTKTQGPTPHPHSPDFPAFHPPLQVQNPAAQAYVSPRFFVRVWITGGASFPRVNYTNYVPFFQGLSIRKALTSSGFVAFEPQGFIRNLTGVPIEAKVGVRIVYNGKLLPKTEMDSFVHPGSSLDVDLFYMDPESNVSNPITS